MSKQRRINIYHNGQLIGQDYLTEAGNWRHKWAHVGIKGGFERGSWPGKCQGETQSEWFYKEIECLNNGERN